MAILEIEQARYRLDQENLAASSRLDDNVWFTMTAPLPSLLLALLLAGLPSRAAEPALDVAAIDRGRILLAAAAALELAPLSITRFPAKFSEGGPNDY